ncbi:MAG: PqqD family protein [Egibacteraceae bacterium]
MRDETFLELRHALSPENLHGAMRCGVRLYAALPERRQLERNVVMVAYGGGKDSSYTVAFVRAMQLMLFRIHGTTFRMRVVTNRHAGMPHAVLKNIHRAYDALGLFGDPDCELLLVDGNEVGPFRVDGPQRACVVERNRLDILMTGHRTFADARPTFCNACNLSMVNAFGLAASHGDGVDLIITGDSPQEQRAYTLWVNRLARQFDLAPKAAQRKGFKGFLTTVDNIAEAYFRDIHGPDVPAVVAERRVTTDVPSGLQFFSIYDDTAYASNDHWRLLTEYLGFEFDDLAFSFTESDCGNPALMAHLRGLKCERLYGRSYSEGLVEYVQFALALMRKKEFPELLVETMRARYHGAAAEAHMRDAANAYALEAYGLTEEQLVCMVYSPFAGNGQGLAAYLVREQPRLADRVEEVHALLDGAEPDATDRLLTDELERISGLTLPQLQVLYRSTVRTPEAGTEGTKLLDAILAGDPHKDVIRTRHTPDGPDVLELISGR